MNWSDKLKAVGTVGAGGLAGVLGAILLAPDSSNASIEMPSVVKQAQVDIEEMERRLEAKLMRGLRASNPSEEESHGRTEPSEEASDVGEELDPDVATEQLKTEYAADIAAHEADARDATWAAESEHKMAATITGIAGNHELLDIECKTTSCVATLEWPSMKEALDGYKGLLHGNFDPNCAVKIMFEQPHNENSTLEVQEKLMFDCVDERARQ